MAWLSFQKIGSSEVTKKFNNRVAGWLGCRLSSSYVFGQRSNRHFNLAEVVFLKLNNEKLGETYFLDGESYQTYKNTTLNF